ncbi:COR domain-containing protein [Pseudoalteromonas xiamenensis]
MSELFQSLKLVKLTQLNICNADLFSLEPISHLSSLISLSLDQLNLINLDFISKFEDLEFFSLFSNNLVESVNELSACKKLKRISLAHCQVRDITGFAHLPQLEMIMIAKNPILDISPISQLKNLKDLHIINTPIKTLKPLTSCFSLESVLFYSCDIRHLDESLLDLNLPINIDKRGFSLGENRIYLVDNPITFPPLEIAQQGNEVMRAYYDSLEGETEKLNEAKLILVGEGAAGKTSLINRFIDNRYDPKEDKTDGISIRTWQCEVEQDENTKIHCWDFGGQEIMRATHQLFLSARSLYLVVLDGRKGDNPEHWLKQVMAVSSNSPIIVVLNKCDEHYDDDLRRQYLKEKYPNIRNFYKVSCKNGEGLEELKHAVIKEIADLDMRKFVLAQNWIKIKQTIETLKQNRDHITQQEFYSICEQHNVRSSTVQDIILKLLHDLGHVIHFNALSELETQVLNPTWITEGIYTLLNSPVLAKQHGILSKNDAETILASKYSCHRYRGKSSYLMKVMTEFELGYQVTLNNKPSYLIPDLLPTELDKLPELDGGIELIYQYKKYLPPELMARFIVKSHDLQVPNQCWRYGVFLQSATCDSQALVTLDKEDKLIRIHVTGGEQRIFLGQIRQFFAAIHKSYQADNIGLETFIPLRDRRSEKESLIKYNRLVELERKEIKEDYDDVLGITFSVIQLLDGIEASSERKVDQQQQGVVVHIKNNIEQSPHFAQTTTQTNSQQNQQSNHQRTEVSVKVQVQTFSEQFKDWGNNLIDDLKDDPEAQKEPRLIERAEREWSRVNDALESVQAIEDENQAQEHNTYFAKVHGFIKDCIEGTNKVGELMKVTGEGIGKVQSLGKEYNKLASNFGLPVIPPLLLGE